MPEIKETPNPTPTPRLSFSQLRQAMQNVGFKVLKRILQSLDFVSGVSGWRLNADGGFEGNVGTFRGGIVGSSINIPNTTTPLFSVDASGNATAIGISSLNMKAYTNFETAGRFVTSVGGTGATTFGNQGVTVAPGATATSYARMLWWITNYVFANNPTFTCSLLALGLNSGSGDGAAFVGLGIATVSGTGYSFNTNHCGFYIRKSGSTINVASEMNDATVGGAVGNNLTTIVDGDSLELFIKMTATAVKFYYRKNGGTLTLGDTLTTRIPTASEQYISFSSTNMGTAVDFQIQFQCAAYEH